MKLYYPVSAPAFVGNENKYIMDCLNSTWISSKGKYIDLFEAKLADFCNTKYAIVCSSGTTALHLALVAHGVGPGDEVIVPTLTFVATANAVVYCGAKPVFVDIESDTWNLDANQLEKHITPATKAIIPVHLFGHPADMAAILQVAGRHGLVVIEDAAESIGATYQGKMAGSLGSSAVFSFFGNKIITTGEGGAITTNDDEVAQKARQLREQGTDPNKRYWHPVIGYNYRMTNLQAAIGCAQLENIKWHLEQRVRVAGLYRDVLKNDDPRFRLPTDKAWANNVYWMFSIVLEHATEVMRDALIDRLRTMGIETRPFFHPMHTLPPYVSLQNSEDFPVANQVASCGINLPTFANLREGDIRVIANAIDEALQDSGA